jgi:hypothetical protein
MTMLTYMNAAAMLVLSVDFKLATHELEVLTI